MRRLRLLVGLLVLIVGTLEPAAAAGPELTVVAPKDGAVVESGDVTITFTTSGIKLVPTTVPVAEAGKRPEANKPGEGHLHFVLDLQPLVVWEQDAPYTFTDVPPGEHQLTVELVNNDHSPLAPPVTRQIRFQATGMQALPRTGADSGSFDGAPGLFALAALLAVALGFALRRASAIRDH